MSEEGREGGGAAHACEKCGRPLPGGALSGVCPTCLLKRTKVPGLSASDPSEFEPLTAGELSELMDGYEVIALINRGGMGAVYKATQLALDRPVAIKMLPLEVAADPEFEDRFSREAKTMARLDHAGIVRIHEFGDIEGQFYFVMEFVDGRDLAQVLQEGSPPPDEALELLLQIADALAYAHGQGIVHRDIKPGNVMLGADGRAKITDFGLAKITGAGGAAYDITQTRASLGTPHYMAPEQHRGSAKADARADIYSFGVLAYELLTGKLPIGNFAPPSELAPVGLDVDRLVLRALRSEPGERFQSAAELRDELGAAVRNAGRAAREKLTAVLLFTDLVDSVGLNARLGTEAYVRAIDRHDAIIKTVLDSTADAKVLQHTGDGFLIRVALASEAVSAALRIQYRMTHADWGGEAPRVRIGLHLGEVVEITEHNTGVTKPVGLATNIASRIAALATGGQVLMSRVIFDEARQYLKQHPEVDGEPAARGLPLSWPAHGRYLFQGTDEPVEIFEVGATGVAPLAPPPDTEKAKRAVAAI